MNSVSGSEATFGLVSPDARIEALHVSVTNTAGPGSGSGITPLSGGALGAKNEGASSSSIGGESPESSLVWDGGAVESLESDQLSESLSPDLENVENYEPHPSSEVGLVPATESGSDESEPEVDAFFGSLDESEQEFFGALIGPVLGAIGQPIVKAVGGALLKKGKGLAKGHYNRLRRTLPFNLPHWEAQQQEPGSMLEVVIGADDRTEITKTTIAPWNGIAQLSIKSKSGSSYFGTGWFISPRVLITAGHCVYLHGAGGWASQIKVSPGRRNTVLPFGTAVATKFFSVVGWVRDKNRSFDYGAIVLDRPITSRCGTPMNFDFAAMPDEVLKTKNLNLSGYPADSPSTGKNGLRQWYHARAVKRVTATTIEYDIDTGGGQSGSPVWVRVAGSPQRIAVGIHTNGFATANSATRINASVKTNLDRWKSA